MIATFNAKMVESKNLMIAEGIEKKKKMVGESLVQNLKFQDKMSSIKKDMANIGAPSGVTTDASVPMTEQPQGKSSWRRARKRRNKVMQRRPGQ